MPLLKPLLSFDTAGHRLSVGLAVDKNIITNQETITHSHSDILLPMIKKTINMADIKINDIKTILITLGPGSFTGIRVGIAAAMGLGFATNINLYGIDNLSARALGHLQHHAYYEDKNFLVLADSRRDEIFYQRYLFSIAQKKMIPLMPDIDMASKDILLKKYKNDEVLTGDVVMADMLGVLLSQDKHYGAGDFISDHLSPLYGRKPDVIKMR
ncbi:MAG: tRNA (adenosine(37)-N6)-threonylcarbamoyltransferase complex dimerization subunit type 1 TsaB [Alphaproteobacteria bacterium]